MATVILSACLLVNVTGPLSPTELRSPRPEPGSLAYGLYAVRAARTVREGMAPKEVAAILGTADNFALFCEWRDEPGLDVQYIIVRRTEVAGEKPKVRLQVKDVRFVSLPKLCPRP